MKLITGNLFSVSGGVKTQRRLFRALAIVAFAAFSTNIYAEGSTDGPDDGIVAPIDGLEDLKGKTIKELKDSATIDGVYPEAKGKMFFLYNVKSGRFLNIGGFWGTHVSLKEYGVPLWVVCKDKDKSDVIRFAQEMSTDTGHYLSWLGNADSSNPDDGVFVDRGETEGYGWKLEETKDDKNTYRIFTYTNTSGTGEKYYLCSNKGEVDVDKNCGAISESEFKSDAGYAGYDEWRIFSYQQIFELQDKNIANMTESLDLSFKLKCPGFSRGVAAINQWKTYDFGSRADNAVVRYGLEHLHNIAVKGKPFEWNKEQYDVNDLLTDNFKYTFDNVDYVGDSKSSDGNPEGFKNYRRHLGKYFCVDAKNIRGIIYQDITVEHTGSYVIECKGYSTTEKAVLFAGLLDPERADSMVENTMRKTVLSQVKYMSAEEQERLHTSEQNMDYAGKEFYGSHKYTNSVLVQVPENTTSKTIRFGIMVGDYNENDAAETGEWTVFDDFRLLYASNTTAEDLVLDENRDNLTYLTECSNTFKNKTLHLKKTFEKDKWNSFVLPVDLDKDQFTQAFGANARLAELTKLENSEIHFTSVNFADKANTDVVLNAYKPYIIFPTKDLANEKNPAYTANLTKTGSDTEHDKYLVKVDENHIDILNVNLATKADGTNDLSKMNTDTWTTTEVGGDNTMAAYGTFARTFGTVATDNEDGSYSFTNDGTIISGRDDLKGAYFLDRGEMWHSDSRVRGLRGFSCWFRPVGEPSATMRLTIDGITQTELTGIEGIAYGDGEMSVCKFRGGIYNMNGQLVRRGTDTSALKPGIYVVNGRKQVVE